MRSTAAERPAVAAGRPALPSGAVPAPPRPRTRPGWVPPVACVAVALLSLLGPSAPTYDPWAWILWGREILQGDLVTTYGPSWKPLPVLFTTPFALLGDEAAPLAWLVVARAGGLLAIWMAFALAARLGGRVAGGLAAVALAFSEDFVRHFLRGNSEGLLVALCLWAVALHLDHRRTGAFALGVAAALLRPEVWPFLGLYGLWLALAEPRRRILVAGSLLAIGILWFVPEYFGSGDFLRAAERARDANPDSAAFAERPILEVFSRAAGLLPWPVWAGGLVGVALAWRARRRRAEARTLLLLAGVAAVLMLGVGVMTEAGFAGNLRYVALPVALVCVLAGVGWTWLAARARAWRPAAALALIAALGLAAAPSALAAGRAFDFSMERLAREAADAADLERALAAAGGAAAIEGCGRVTTGPYEVQLLAYVLDRHGSEIGVSADPPAVIVALREHPLASDDRFERIATTEHWVVRSSCRGS